MVVRCCAERGQAELYALVLSAKGIEVVIVRDADGFTLLVAPKTQVRLRRNSRPMILRI